jgi:DNA mismatch repair protein MSH5
MIDLSQVSHALRGATRRSLIVLDEFGKGTTAADGAGLLAGIILHLIEGPSPRTIVLTHFQYVTALFNLKVLISQ